MKLKRLSLLVLGSVLVTLGSWQRAVALPYAAEVLSDSPIAYWRFDETSGSIATDSAGSNDGTWIGASQGNGSATPGLGKAAGFDGTSSRINVPALGSATNLSIEAWFRASNLPAVGNWMVLYDTQFFGATALHWQLFTNGASQTVNEFALGFSDTNNTFAFSQDTWYYIVGTYDNTAGTGQLYVNGVLVETLFTGAPPHTTNLLVADIGAWVPAGTPFRVFDGLIDEVAIYGSTLSPARIAAHYEAAFASVPEPGSLALLGAALAGFGLSRRKPNQ